MLTKVDCDELHMYNVIPRATTKKLYKEMYLRTLQISQSRILKKCSNNPQQDMKSETEEQKNRTKQQIKWQRMFIADL